MNSEAKWFITPFCFFALAGLMAWAGFDRSSWTIPLWIGLSVFGFYFAMTAWYSIQRARHLYKTNNAQFWGNFWAWVAIGQWIILFYLVWYASNRFFPWGWETDEDGEPINHWGFWASAVYFWVFHVARKRVKTYDDARLANERKENLDFEIRRLQERIDELEEQVWNLGEEPA